MFIDNKLRFEVIIIFNVDVTLMHIAQFVVFRDK